MLNRTSKAIEQLWWGDMGESRSAFGCESGPPEQRESLSVTYLKLPLSHPSLCGTSGLPALAQHVKKDS